MTKKNTIIYLVIALLLVVSAILFFVSISKINNDKLNSIKAQEELTKKQMELLKNKKSQESVVETKVPKAEAEKIPEEIKKIMNDNISGVVEKITDKSITVKAEDGKTMEMPMETGKTFVIGQTENVMMNKKISDIKVGMKVYVHFEKVTNMATTITLL